MKETFFPSEMKKLWVGVAAMVVFLMSGVPAFAHAVIKPNQAGVGEFVDFSLGVPSEKDVATTGVKLLVPAGINSVSPIVKTGWKVEVVNSTQQGQPDDDGNTNPVPEAIVWSGGLVPAHQKDFFMFSTQVPAQPTELVWKVEQTYADGTVVSWTLGSNDVQPKDSAGKTDYSKFGPYSKTMVVNDLTASPVSSSKPQGETPVVQSSTQSKLPTILGVTAILVSLIALGMTYAQVRKMP